MGITFQSGVETNWNNLRKLSCRFVRKYVRPKKWVWTLNIPLNKLRSGITISQTVYLKDYKHSS